MMPNTNNTDHGLRHYRKRGLLHGVMSAIVVLTASASALTWSWNTLVVSMANMPGAQFKHGLAAAVGLMAVFLIYAWAARLVQGPQGVTQDAPKA